MRENRWQGKLGASIMPIMQAGIKRTLAANAALFSGITFTILGAGTLLSSIAGGSRGGAFLASFAIVAGVMLAFVAVRLHHGARFIFGAAFLIQTGVFLILLAGDVFQSGLSELWPVFVVFAGISLFPAGWFHYKAPRARYIIPMVAFLLLGLIFLLFSFDIVSMSFKKFILDWWPLLLVLAGVLLTLTALASGSSSGENGS